MAMIGVVPRFPVAVAYLFVPGGITSRSCGPGRAPERNRRGVIGGPVLRTDNSERVSRTLVDPSGTAASYTAIAKNEQNRSIVARTPYAVDHLRRDGAIKVHHYLEQRCIVEIMTKCRLRAAVFAPRALPVRGSSAGTAGAWPSGPPVWCRRFLVWPEEIENYSGRVVTTWLIRPKTMAPVRLDLWQQGMEALRKTRYNLESKCVTLRSQIFANWMDQKSLMIKLFIGLDLGLNYAGTCTQESQWDYLKTFIALIVYASCSESFRSGALEKSFSKRKWKLIFCLSTNCDKGNDRNARAIVQLTLKRFLASSSLTATVVVLQMATPRTLTTFPRTKRQQHILTSDNDLRYRTGVSAIRRPMLVTLNSVRATGRLPLPLTWEDIAPVAPLVGTVTLCADGTIERELLPWSPRTQKTPPVPSIHTSLETTQLTRKNNIDRDSPQRHEEGQELIRI
ncbi:hypothetical protein GEV33_004757 [Tenebrio molitor]|uniref:Uncharacterized protein n=1 Tax=Tenebrio molitor TaxID=7067 RepID=A0A8J6LD56_TENMO|nr:hypothetical protein GEV33_004757 [Tenebrio molitor]